MRPEKSEQPPTGGASSLTSKVPPWRNVGEGVDNDVDFEATEVEEDDDEDVDFGATEVEEGDDNDFDFEETEVEE